MVDQRYREEEVLPQLREALRHSYEVLSRELDDSDEMVRLLWRYGQGEELSDLERGAAKQQLTDLAKTVPCLGIFLLPGGAVLLPLLARILPFDMFPRAFGGRGPKPPLFDAEEPEHFRMVFFYSSASVSRQEFVTVAPRRSCSGTACGRVLAGAGGI